jgi:arylformamidase
MAGRASRRLVELSHVIEDGMVTYPGLPAPQLSDHLTREEAKALYAPGVTFQIGRITMVGNTGTYMDSPFHRFADGADLADVPLDKIADLDAVVLACEPGQRAIGARELAGLDVAGKAVLLATGWDAKFRTPAYGESAPFLGADGVAWLVKEQAALVGIDAVNIDDVGDRARPAHTGLLGAGIPIVEHLRGLTALPAAGFRFTATPPRVRGFGTFPVRAFAVVDGALPE